MHQNCGKIGEGVIRFLSRTRSYTFRAPNHGAKFHQNRIKIAAVRVFRDGMTVWQKWFYNLSRAML